MKRSSLAHIPLLAILALFIASSPAEAANQVANVVAARGDVQALDAKGKGRPLTVQAPIFEDDTIKTGERSRVQIMFTDNTLVSLGTATTMKIAEYRWQPEKKEGALKTQIKEGTFRVMGGAITKEAPQNFKTETPTATIGIRGSMYAGVATADFLSVVFQGGKGIEITNPFGTVEITKPGYGTKVALDKPPLPPMKFTTQELGEMNKTLGGNGSEEKSDKKEEKKEKGQEKSPKESDQKKEEKGKKEEKTQEKGVTPKERQATATTTNEPTGTTATEPKAASTPPEAGATTAIPVAESGTTASATTTAAATPPAPAPTPFLGGLGSTVTVDPVATISPLPTATTFTMNLLVPLVPTNMTTDLVADASQGTIQTDLTATATATTLTGSGAYRAFRRDSNHTVFLDWASGSFDFSLSGGGVFEGTLTNDGNSGVDNITNFPVSLDANSVSSSGLSFTLPVSYNDPSAGQISMTATTTVAPTGDFFYTTIYHSQAASPDNLLIGFLGYAGTASGSIPSAGIDSYTGRLLHNHIPAANAYDADLEETAIEVSYYNKRFIGRSKDQNASNNGGAVFFGTVNNNGTASNIIVLASGDSQVPAPNYVTTAYGDTGTATFYGSNNQGIGFTASGGDYSIATGTQLYSWQATGAAIRSGATEYITSYPTAAMQYTGYMVGVGDNINGGKVSRVFMNNSPTLSMTVNPGTGVVSGSFSANELTGGTPLSSITIGDPTDLTKSAYILNDQMVAILSDNDANYVLKSQGNFLVTAGPDNEITKDSTEYLTWGHWEMAYDDPNDASKDHIFSSQSFFVAGQQTAPDYITNNLLNRTLTGTYDGKAYGVKIAEVSTGIFDATALTNGTTHLVINFQNPAAAGAISGNITFSEATLTIGSAASALTSSGFTANVSNIHASGTNYAPASSQVNGAFYGPTATAVGGNFQALLSDSTRYIGVFGGSGPIQ